MCPQARYSGKKLVVAGPRLGGGDFFIRPLVFLSRLWVPCLRFFLCCLFNGQRIQLQEGKEIIEDHEVIVDNEGMAVLAHLRVISFLRVHTDLHAT
jgi:hypothetical protein